MGSREDSWLQTYTGKRFHPFAPNPDDVCLEDIAHALSQTCRFGGMCRIYYSVAQHLHLCCGLLRKDVGREALMHDAAEAYLVDLPTPIKRYFPFFKEIEEGIDRAIAERFGLKYPWPDEVKRVDRQMLRIERRELFDVYLEWEALPTVDVIPCDHPTGEIVSWNPPLAKKAFLELAAEYELR
jgi:hypothetical protein